MEATNIDRAVPPRRTTLSPWPVFGAALVLCWVLLIQHHLSGHASAHAATAATAFAMWSLMTIGMMVPTAVPVLVSLRNVLGSTSTRPWWAFLGGYLLVWIGFAGVAAATQLRLIDLDVIGHNGASTSQVFSAIVLAFAGAYQFTSLKRRCITKCVNPMTYFLRHWRDGVVGGARMGVRHGVACLGCCWALMLLSFVGGIANIWFMALAAVVMAVEKVPAVSRFVTVPLGFVLVVTSVVVAIAAATGGGEPHHPADHQMSIEQLGHTKGTQ